MAPPPYRRPRELPCTELASRIYIAGGRSAGGRSGEQSPGEQRVDIRSSRSPGGRSPEHGPEPPRGPGPWGTARPGDADRLGDPAPGDPGRSPRRRGPLPVSDGGRGLPHSGRAPAPRRLGLSRAAPGRAVYGAERSLRRRLPPPAAGLRLAP